MEQIIGPIIMVLSIGIAFLVVHYKLKRYREMLSRLGKAFERAEVKGTLMLQLAARYRGYNLKIEPRSGGKNSPPMVYVRLYRKNRFTMIIYREGGVQKFFKRLGLLREVEIGDRSFDEKFIVRADNDMRARTYLSKEKVRTAVEDIFQRDYKRLQFDKNMLWAYRVTRNMDAALSDQEVVPVVERLVELAEAMNHLY